SRKSPENPVLYSEHSPTPAQSFPSTHGKPQCANRSSTAALLFSAKSPERCPHSSQQETSRIQCLCKIRIRTPCFRVRFLNRLRCIYSYLDLKIERFKN